MWSAYLWKTYQTCPHCNHTYSIEIIKLSFLSHCSWLTILTRTLKPEELEKHQANPQSKSGFIKAMSVLSDLFNVQLVLCFRFNPTQPKSWCDFMRLIWRLHCFPSVGPGQRELRNLFLEGKLSTCWASVRETSGTGGPKLDEDINMILRGPKWDELKHRYKINEPLVLWFCKIYNT